MSVNDSHPAEAYQVETPPRRGFRPGPLAGRALLFVFGFFASLAAIILIFLAARSQMQWEVAPQSIRDKYAPAVAKPVPPANRPTTPADVGDVDPNGPGASGASQPGYRPSLAPGFGSGAPAESPYGNQQFTPSVTPAAPAPRPAPRPDTSSAAPPPARPAAPPRAAAAPKQEPPVASSAPEYRRVAGKTFKQRSDGFLVDTTYQDGSSLPVVELAAGGDAYEHTLDAHRELARFFRLSDRLVLVSDDVVYRIHP